MRRNQDQQPTYAQIALDIAARIVRGDLLESSKFSGRSKMSSEYGVSPETVRRALMLLEKAQVVEIFHNSGVVIKSKAAAMEYLQQQSFQKGIHQLKSDLREAIKEKEELNRKINRLIEQIVDYSEHYSYGDPIRKYELLVEPDSWLVNKTIKQAKFYQETKATIIAIRRDQTFISSPLASFKIAALDVIIAIGSVEIVDDVKAFVSKKNQ